MASKADSDSAKVFISYRSKDPDQLLARQFQDALQAVGHEAFMAAASIRLGENWSQRIDQELEQCDYLLLLLSEKSAASEMVIEEVRRARELRDSRPAKKPTILPIRVQFPISASLNYDLRGYLNPIQQREWRSPEDTAAILQEILSLLETGGDLQKDESEQELVTASPVFQGSGGRPLPVAEPEVPRGQLSLASAFYVKRDPLETTCYEEIEKQAALIRIKAPRQMGKTSLMARILHHAQEQDYRTTSVTFQLTDETVFQDLNQFLRRFCALVSRKLKFPLSKLADFWEDEFFGPKENCSTYFEECLLADLNSPFVLGLDELDRIFAYETVAKEFLSLLRTWNEAAKVNDTWGKLRLVVVHSTESYVVMDTNSSPFNVGLPINLEDFEPAQVLDLAKRHGLDWGSREVNRLMEMVGGHPYLVRVALYQIAKHTKSLEQVLVEAPTEAGIYGDHLRRHLWNLEQHPDLLNAIRQTAATNSPVRLESIQGFKLNGMGLVDLQKNDVTLRYDLYRRYFRDRLRLN
ncbi:MAG: AAA-like domain-containing protein [Pseudanabaenales cyanobacterium]|nr:AAA-like domain-containing protein [Pseudanabaenales cyanobacterium]